MTEPGLGELLRPLAPQVLGVVGRRHQRFDLCEDAVQEALLAAARSWPEDGVPANPTGWLVTVAHRRVVDALRQEASRRRREVADAAAEPDEPPSVPHRDDTLALLVLCCHPSLTPPAQVALTLRAVGGLTTAEIARGLMVPETTVGQRISRAKARIAADGARFATPSADELAERLPAVLHVLYLVFNEGYAASSGERVHRVELTAEAVRLTRELVRSRPGHGEATGLLALMLLTDARRAARTAPDGALVPLADQDRTRWDTGAVTEGVSLLTSVLGTAAPGPYQLQAAIAAVHDEAPSADRTDWRQLLGLYEALSAIAPGPLVSLGRVVAVAEVRGPQEALDQLDVLSLDHHRAAAVRAHLLERLGRYEEARTAYRLAAARTLSEPERRYLLDRAATSVTPAGGRD